VEIPYRFDDRELGESKMSKKEAAGYLFQLKDLYGVRLTGPRKAAREYRRLSAAEVDKIAQAAR
jgi:hypothetical protein